MRGQYQYLVERGVRLDVVTPSGISLDYYLQDWQDGVFAEHPAGWERLRVAIATRRSSSNPTSLVTELGTLPVSEDPKLAHDALHCMGLLPAPPKEMIPAVQAAGREIAARINQFNNTPPEQDPDFETAVDPATRFYGWLPAAQALREKCGGDFTPELQTILRLSRIRPESHCMRQDVCRVASFYLHEWAGVAPLATDPKPR